MINTLMNKKDAFKTILRDRRIDFVFEDSLVFAVSRYVENEVQAKKQIDKIRTENPNYSLSYVLLLDKEKKPFTCDGKEPKHTSSKFMLDEMKKSGITNVLICVLRKFGEIRLSVVELESVYKNATTKILETSGTTIKQLSTIISFQLDYTDAHTLEDIVEGGEVQNIKILETDFMEEVYFELAVANSGYKQTMKELEDKLGKSIKAKILETRFE